MIVFSWNLLNFTSSVYQCMDGPLIIAIPWESTSEYVLPISVCVTVVNQADPIIHITFCVLLYSNHWDGSTHPHPIIWINIIACWPNICFRWILIKVGDHRSVHAMKFYVSLNTHRHAISYWNYSLFVYRIEVDLTAMMHS